MELKLSKKIVKVVLVLTMAFGLFFANTSKASEWRESSTRSISGYILAGRADLPYNADSREEVTGGTSFIIWIKKITIKLL